SAVLVAVLVEQGAVAAGGPDHAAGGPRGGPVQRQPGEHVPVLAGAVDQHGAAQSSHRRPPEQRAQPEQHRVTAEVAAPVPAPAPAHRPLRRCVGTVANEAASLAAAARSGLRDRPANGTDTRCTSSGRAVPIRTSGARSAARTRARSAPGSGCTSATSRSSPSSPGTPTSTARSTPGTCSAGSYRPG